MKSDRSAEAADTTDGRRILPLKHVAIIMDGNGRWAKQRGKLRTWGHREGAKRVDDIVTAAARWGLPYLTLFAFSTENWSRPSQEVSVLMKLLVQYLRSMDKKLISNQVSLTALGSIERLPEAVQKELRRVIELTHLPNPRLRLSLCLSYGGRQEIVDAAKGLVSRVQAGEIRLDQIDELEFQKGLYRPDFPDPDLLIRTGGESRVSNFLLWEIAYAEIFVSPLNWPEFGPEELWQAIEYFASRERRYGKTSEQVQEVVTS